LKCAPKKSKIPPNFFVPSAIPSVSAVGIHADRQVSGMRGPSVLTVGNSIGISADRQVACMRGSSVFTVGNFVGIRADGHVSGMRSPENPSVIRR
jgi:hypothetical protein